MGGDLARRVLLMEENAVKYEGRLAVSVTNLAKTSIEADKGLKQENEMSQGCAKQSEEKMDLSSNSKMLSTLGQSPRTNMRLWLENFKPRSLKDISRRRELRMCR